MRTATTVIQMLVRLIGLIMIVLGLLFWTGYALTLTPIHMLLGFVLVLLLWALAVMGLRAGSPRGLAALAIVWGLILPVLGLTQTQLLPGDAHWVIRVLHLLVGLGALGLAERLAARIKQAQIPALRQNDAAPASTNPR